MKKINFKLIVAILAVAVLATVAISGTVAWLTDSTSTVVNTFTVGDIDIELKEHEYVPESNTLNNNLVDKNENYKVIPGGTSPKDPMVTVNKGSEKCYVYALVKNNLVVNGNCVATLAVNSSWSPVASITKSDGTTETLYKYSQIVDALAESKTLPAIFNSVTYDGEAITKENISQLTSKTIEITAYAHQSENTTSGVADSAAVAWSDILNP